MKLSKKAKVRTIINNRGLGKNDPELFNSLSDYNKMKVLLNSRVYLDYLNYDPLMECGSFIKESDKYSYIFPRISDDGEAIDIKYHSPVLHLMIKYRKKMSPRDSRIWFPPACTIYERFHGISFLVRWQDDFFFEFNRDDLDFTALKNGEKKLDFRDLASCRKHEMLVFLCVVNSYKMKKIIRCLIPTIVDYLIR